MKDWEIIESVLKQVCAIKEISWRDIFKDIRCGCHLERNRIRAARCLISYYLSKFFEAEFIHQMFNVTYQKYLIYRREGFEMVYGNKILEALERSIKYHATNHPNHHKKRTR